MENMNNHISENQQNQVPVESPEIIETQDTVENQKNPKIKKGRIVGIIAAVSLVLVGVLLIILLGGNARKYKKALALIEEGEYKEAYRLFSELGDYKDSKERLEHFIYVPSLISVEMDIDGEKLFSSIKFEYNKLGLVDKKTTTYSDSGQKIETSGYDKNGNIIKNVTKTSGEETASNEYTYDSKGNLTKRVSVYPDGRKEIYEYTHDSKGNVTKEFAQYSDGRKSTTDYTYDSKGNVTKEVRIYSDGHGSTIDCTYDSKGNLTKRVNTYYDGYEVIDEYTYDSNGNVIKEVQMRSDGFSLTIDYTYDSKGNVIKEVDTYSDGRKLTIDYIYDSKGNLIEENQTDDSGDIYTIRYSYDENNNMIKFAFPYDFSSGFQLKCNVTSSVEYVLVYAPDIKASEAKENVRTNVIMYISNISLEECIEYAYSNKT